MGNSLMAGSRKNFGYYASRGVSYLVFITWTLVTLFPLIWMLYSSFKSNNQIITRFFDLPTVMLWENYSIAWDQAHLGQLFVNSLIYSTVSTFFIVMFSMMAAYAFAKMDFPKISNALYAVIGLGLLISVQAILIPLFIMLAAMGLKDSHVGIIMTYVALGLPMAIYLATEFVRGIPDSLIESAYIDGASNFRMFKSIVLPMTTPVIVTISIITVLGIWNEFLLVFVLTSSDATRSLPVGVMSFAGAFSQQYGRQLAAMVVAVAPVMVVYFIFNKRLTQGVVAGAVKG